MDSDINDGLLRQQIAVASVAPGVLAYIDRVTAQKAVTVTEERGLLLGIENDEVSSSARHLQTGGNIVILSFVAPDGRHHALALAADGTAHWNGAEIKRL